MIFRNKKVILLYSYRERKTAEFCIARSSSLDRTGVFTKKNRTVMHKIIGAQEYPSINAS